MNLVVCVKQTPSSEARVTVASDGKSIDPANTEFVINPYDEYAVEEALLAREKFGGTITAVTVGPQKSQETLRHCLALGVDRVMMVKAEELIGADPYGIASILAAAIRPLEADLILCGKVAIDVENTGTGVALAELMGLPHVGVASKVEWTDEKHLKIHREIEGASELVELELPAVVTAEKGLNEPRYPKLPGIMKAKKKPIEELDAEALAVDPAAVGTAGSGLDVTRMEPPPPRAEGKTFTGEATESVGLVLAALRDERKLL